MKFIKYDKVEKLLRVSIESQKIRQRKGGRGCWKDERGDGRLITE